MLVVLLLAFLGFLLIYLEFFFPRVILGISGALLIGASLLGVFWLKGVSMFLLFYFLGLLLFFILVVKLALWHLRNGEIIN
jgi:hypothetical protein